MLEEEAERSALPFVYGVSFTDCLRLNGIETEKEVEGKKICAHRIYAAWNRFLIVRGTGGTTTVSEAGPLMEEMFDWITTSKTYQVLTTGEEKQWLEIIIRFVVYQRIMEAKYHQWITTGKGFADPSVACLMTEIYRFRSELPSVARLIHKTIGQQKQLSEEERKQLTETIVAGVFAVLRVDRLRALPALEKRQLVTEAEMPAHREEGQ